MVERDEIFVKPLKIQVSEIVDAVFGTAIEYGIDQVRREPGGEQGIPIIGSGQKVVRTNQSPGARPVDYINRLTQFVSEKIGHGPRHSVGTSPNPKRYNDSNRAVRKGLILRDGLIEPDAKT